MSNLGNEWLNDRVITRTKEKVNPKTRTYKIYESQEMTRVIKAYAGWGRAPFGGKTPGTRYVESWSLERAHGHVWKSTRKKAESCLEEIEQINRIEYWAMVKVGTKRKLKVDQTKLATTTLKKRSHHPIHLMCSHNSSITLLWKRQKEKVTMVLKEEKGGGDVH